MNKQLFFKLLSLGLLALLLAFAVLSVEWKVQERSATRDGAVRSIAEQYAREQQITGPLIWVQCTQPRSFTNTDKKGVKRQHEVNQDCSYAIRPTLLKANGGLEVSERYRGIYKTRVYLANLQVHAQIPADKRKAREGQIIDRATLVFGVSDPRGLKGIQIKNSAGQLLSAQSGVPGGRFDNGFHVPLPLQTLDSGISIDATLEIAGSGRLDLVPIATQNEFNLSSGWRHPSFSGAFLPEKREVTAQGFSARWRINDFATGGDRILQNKEGTSSLSNWLPTTLGVSLIDPVDAYTQTDRAVRYGFLFVLLTLGGFFLFEMLKSRSVHPLQYLLVGFAVVLFFLLLLALSEHLAFSLAYVIAAAACVLLITAYGRSLLGSWRGATSLGVGYGLLYFGLYQLLASEDYALLMGAWLIFGVLALTMYLTRRLDWNSLGKKAQPQ